MEMYYCDTIMYDICLVSTMFQSFGGLLLHLRTTNVLNFKYIKNINLVKYVYNIS